MMLLMLQWEGLVQYGDVDDDDLNSELQKRINAQVPNGCCTLVYTVRTLRRAALR